MNVNFLSNKGLLFLWVINCKFEFGFDLLEHWGYEFFDCIHWVKIAKNGNQHASNGHYLRHAKEMCLIGNKRNFKFEKKYFRSAILAERGAQSEKPTLLYTMIEKMVPNGRYIELFGRKNNLRDKWITLGNEL